MMRQYGELKRRFPDYLLLFRLGDFYELFNDDAHTASRLLQLTLTSRQGVPMAGVPHHAADNYIARLIRAGQKVAVCEQLEEPAKGRKIVRRDVVRVCALNLLLAVVVFGLFSYPRIGVDQMPEVDFPIVTVTTILPGADPETIEENVSKPLEEALNTLSGLETLRSQNFESVSNALTATLSAGYPLDTDFLDLIAAEERIREAVILARIRLINRWRDSLEETSPLPVLPSRDRNDAS